MAKTQCCHNWETKIGFREARGVENRCKNPYKNDFFKKNVENVELLWKRKPLVHMNSSLISTFPRAFIFFAKYFLKRYFNPFFVETWKPACYMVFSRKKMWNSTWKNYGHRKRYGTGNKYDDRGGLLG